MNKNFSSLPVDVQEKAKKILTAFDTVNIEFYNGEYHVSKDTFVICNYPADFSVIGTYSKADIFSNDEMIINYISVFHDYPIEYKGKRNYAMINSLDNMHDYIFAFDDNKNIILVSSKEKTF